MNKKQMQQIIEERVERIGLLEQRLETLSQLLDGYKAREQAIVDSLSQASETAALRLAQADASAKQIVADAQAQADALLGAAREESTRILTKTEIAVRHYEERLTGYHADLERSAAELQATAARYAAFVKEKTRDGEPRPQVDPVFESAPAIDLPDPQDDPQLVMQNIYKLQNRDIPAPPEPDEPDLFEEIVADLGPRPAPMDEPAPAPRPVPKPEAAPEPPPAPAPEWQPEPEREWVPEEDLQGAPSVSALMPDAPPEEEEISLDSLLDEIIAAGDI